MGLGSENTILNKTNPQNVQSQEDGIDVLVPAPPAKFNKKPYTLYTKEDSEEQGEGRLPRTLGPKKIHSGEFPDFSFYLMYLRFGEEASNKKHDSICTTIICYVQESHFKYNIGSLKIKEQKKIYYASVKQKNNKKRRLEWLYQYLIKQTSKKITRDRERYYISIKGQSTNPQEDTAIVKVYAPNKAIKIYEAKSSKTEKTEKSPITAEDFNTSLMTTDRTRQKTNKIIELNKTINQQGPIDIYKTLQGQQNTHSFQVPKEHTAKRTISWAINKSQYIFKN